MQMLAEHQQHLVEQVDKAVVVINVAVLLAHLESRALKIAKRTRV
jgi:hypothetical protein